MFVFHNMAIILSQQAWVHKVRFQVFLYYMYVLERGERNREKVTSCVSCHRTSLCNGCYDLCFEQSQIVDILTDFPQLFHISSGTVLQK